jgi:hypothetical protein
MTETRAARFRAKAAECEQASTLASDRNVKQTYLDMAKQWRDLAEQVEVLDRSSS